jgi:hypothetical protein
MYIISPILAVAKWVDLSDTVKCQIDFISQGRSINRNLIINFYFIEFNFSKKPYLLESSNHPI